LRIADWRGWDRFVLFRELRFGTEEQVTKPAARPRNSRGNTKEKRIVGKDEVMKKCLGFTIVVLGMLGFSSLVFANQEKTSSTSRSNFTWVQQDDNKKIEVKVENKVEFKEDYSDVSAIPDDGALRIHDSEGPQTYKLVVTRGADGQLNREYSVDGRSQPFDARGQAWLRKVLLRAVREGGLDTRNRVKRILKQRGSKGLIEEMGYVKGDYVRRIYFEALLQLPDLNDSDLKYALRNASSSIDGDYERAQLLLQIGNVFLAKNDLVPDYFAAVDKLDSDYEHHRVLKGALKREELSHQALKAMAQSAAKIDSDYEKATFLLEAISRYQPDAQLREAFANTAKTIGSDYERGRVQKRMDRDF